MLYVCDIIIDATIALISLALGFPLTYNHFCVSRDGDDSDGRL